MALSLSSRVVGDITIVTCAGRIVAGAESDALTKEIDELMPFSPHILLHLGAVDFIDSAGLGLLARYLTRVKNAGGLLKVCAVSPKVDDVLRITRLRAVFQPDATEADSIADAHRARARDAFVNPDILCVDSSADVLAYLRELLKEAGYRAITAANVPDALILFKATAPRVVVIGAEMRAARGTRATDEFNALASAGAVVELPSNFSGHDAAEAATHVLDSIRRVVATS